MWQINPSNSMTASQWLRSSGTTPSLGVTEDDEIEGVDQDVSITRVPLSQWRKVKTRAGILPWLGVLLVATDQSDTILDIQDDVQSISVLNRLLRSKPFALRSTQEYSLAFSGKSPCTDSQPSTMSWCILLSHWFCTKLKYGAIATTR
jgi:hypothetical protein